MNYLVCDLKRYQDELFSLRRVMKAIKALDERTGNRARFVVTRPAPPAVSHLSDLCDPRAEKELITLRPRFRRPVGAGLWDEHSFHGLGCARLTAGFAPPVATALRPFGAKLVAQQSWFGYDHNIFTEEELREKLDYCHKNPITRGLTAGADHWRWSSYRFYKHADRSLLAMDWNGRWPIEW